MKVIPLILGTLDSNSYIVCDDEKNAVIIDPADCPQEIIDTLSNYELIPIKILLTHGHFDHILAAEDLSTEYNIPVYVHENDAPLLTDSEKNLFDMFIKNGEFKSVTNICMYIDNDIITAGSMEFKVMHTPGHTGGSSCFITDKFIFTGDTLFCGSIGRTDNYGGNYQDMLKSLEKFKKFGKDYKLYPGHGVTSTLKEELNYNIYLASFDQI